MTVHDGDDDDNDNGDDVKDSLTVESVGVYLRDKRNNQNKQEIKYQSQFHSAVSISFTRSYLLLTSVKHHTEALAAFDFPLVFPGDRIYRY